MYNKYNICHKPSKGILVDFKTQGKAKGFESTKILLAMFLSDLENCLFRNI